MMVFGRVVNIDIVTLLCQYFNVEFTKIYCCMSNVYSLRGIPNNFITSFIKYDLLLIPLVENIISFFIISMLTFMMNMH